MNHLEKDIFSWPSLAIHTIWFAIWLLLKLDINTLTLIVSLEAIYITLFIGLGQRRLHNHAEEQRLVLHQIKNRTKK